jgi:hypothetical protein
LQDRDRGVVWEETIIALPRAARCVFLSATLSNAGEFAAWIAALHRAPCHVVATDFRPVPLEHFILPCADAPKNKKKKGETTRGGLYKVRRCDRGTVTVPLTHCTLAFRCWDTLETLALLSRPNSMCKAWRPCVFHVSPATCCAAAGVVLPRFTVTCCVMCVRIAPLCSEVSVVAHNAALAVTCPAVAGTQVCTKDGEFSTRMWDELAAEGVIKAPWQRQDGGGDGSANGASAKGMRGGQGADNQQGKKENKDNVASRVCFSSPAEF